MRSKGEGQVNKTISLQVDKESTYWQSLFAWDSMLFFTVCSLDMIFTLWWVHIGVAKESNPWLASCLQRGPFAFCVAKIASFVPVLFICAYYRASYPRFVPLALRWGTAAYAAIYIACVAMQFV
jgi:hypothetical protein